MDTPADRPQSVPSSGARARPQNRARTARRGATNARRERPRSARRVAGARARPAAPGGARNAIRPPFGERSPSTSDTSAVICSGLPRINGLARETARAAPQGRRAGSEIEPSGGQTHHPLEKHGTCGERPRERRVLSDDRVQQRSGVSASMSVPPGGDVGGMAQSREAVPCLVEHQRGEVVLRGGGAGHRRIQVARERAPGHRTRPRTSGHASGARCPEGRPRGRERGGAPGRWPIGRSPPAERGEGIDGPPEVLAGHQHVDIARVAHSGVTVQGARQERSFERGVRDPGRFERGRDAQGCELEEPTGVARRIGGRVDRLDEVRRRRRAGGFEDATTQKRHEALILEVGE